jgi:hypothetical protein
MNAKVISLRVSRRLAQALEQAARSRRATKSQVILESLEGLLKREPEQSPYELGEDLFGRHGSGRSDLSARARAHFRDKVREKHARR